MTVKGRTPCLFAEEDALRSRGQVPLKTPDESIQSIYNEIDHIREERKDSQFCDPIIGAISCLVLNGYKDETVKRMVRQYILFLTPNVVSLPAILGISRIQELLCDIYRWPPISADSYPGIDMPRVTRLFTELFEEVVREHGGQEELDKIRRALDQGEPKGANVDV